MIKVVLLLVLCAVLTQAYPTHYGYGYGGAPSFNEYAVNDYNAHRQQAVNARAVSAGAGIGTAPYEGVPGTSHSRYGYGHHGGYGGNYGYFGY